MEPEQTTRMPTTDMTGSKKNSATDDSRQQSIGLKKSRQLSESIESIIKQVPRGVHVTASEVYRRAREAGLEVSLSTIYRTLNLLQQGGNISTVAGEHGRRYEARDSDHDHDHLICLKCGFTVEFEDDLIRGFGKAVAERKGYEHKSSRFDILGICAECKTKDEDHRISAASAAIDAVYDLLDSATADLQNGAVALESRKLAKAIEIMTTSTTKIRDALHELESVSSLLNGPTQPDQIED